MPNENENEKRRQNQNQGDKRDQSRNPRQQPEQPPQRQDPDFDVDDIGKSAGEGGSPDEWDDRGPTEHKGR